MDFEEEKIEFRPEESVDYSETKRLVMEIVDGLSAEQRLAIILFYFEQKSIKEIAEVCECTENTIKSRLNYGRAKIKEAVLDLEKKGTKLYCMPVIPFLYWMLRQEAAVAAVPTATRVATFQAAKGVVEEVATEATAQATVGQAATAVGTDVVTKTGMALGTKVAIGITSAVLVIGGGAVVVPAIQDMFGTSSEKPAEDKPSTIITTIVHPDGSTEVETQYPTPPEEEDEFSRLKDYGEIAEWMDNATYEETDLLQYEYVEVQSMGWGLWNCGLLELGQEIYIEDLTQEQKERLNLSYLFNGGRDNHGCYYIPQYQDFEGDLENPISLTRMYKLQEVETLLKEVYVGGEVVTSGGLQQIDGDWLFVKQEITEVVEGWGYILEGEDPGVDDHDDYSESILQKEDYVLRSSQLYKDGVYVYTFRELYRSINGTYANIQLVYMEKCFEEELAGTTKY